MKTTFIVLGIVLIAWLVCAQSCMKFHIADAEARKQFSDAGVNLQLDNIEVDGFNMHYAKTGMIVCLPYFLFMVRRVAGMHLADI